MDVQFAKIDVRYGIGYGEVKSGNKGPGYKNALKAVEIAKKNKFKIHLRTDNKENNIFDVINLILHLYFKLLNNYNARQNYIIYQIMKGIPLF